MKPSETDSLNCLIYRIFERKLIELGSKYLGGKLIDIGCGVKPYKDLLSEYVEEHLGLDHYETVHDKSNIDIFGSAYNIPVEDGSFDCAICTAVLEHLEEPELAVRECHRVLKPGGKAIYSVPFIWHLHEEPHDYYRYSKYGLKYLFEKVGFETLEIIPLSGFAVTFIQLHLYLVKGKFDKGLIRFLKLYRFYESLFTKIGLFVNRYDNSKQYTWMNIIVVRK